MSTHYCEDHGHYCDTCERQKEDAERAERLSAEVASWNWNLNATEAGQEVLRLVRDEWFEEDDVFAAVAEYFGSKVEFDVESAYYALV
jgi:hypothetical protein